MDKHYTDEDEVLFEIEEAKRWPEITVPMTLADGFGGMTKDELSLVRSNMEVKGVSKLNKKDLCDALVKQVPGLLPRLLNKLDEKRYALLKYVADRNGCAPARIELDWDGLDYFRERGLIFTGTLSGTPTYVMPLEVLDVFRAQDDATYRRLIQRNTEWTLLTLGLLFYYGTLTLSELKGFVEQYTGTELPLQDYLSVLDEAEAFYEVPNYDSHGFSGWRVFSSERVRKEHEMRPTVSFHPFTKTQLLRAGEPDFVDRHGDYRAFVDYLTKTYEMSRQEADQCVEECVYAINIGESLTSVIEWLGYRVEMNDLDAVNTMMQHLIAIHNNTRQWFLKGHTPNELRPATTSERSPRSALKAPVIDLASRRKVGRNDPCPCGSGKKYKKCCGR